MKFRCFVDGGDDDTCVFDNNEEPIENCEVAIGLSLTGEGRDGCPYWKEVDKNEICCPKCNHKFFLE